MRSISRRVVGLGVVAIALAGCDGAGPGGRVGRGAGERPPSASVASAAAAPTPRPVPPAPPPESRHVAAGLTALAPVRDGALLVVPIVADTPAAGPRFLTLDEGMRRGLVTVRELPDVDYGTLRVSNRSAQTLCTMAGEIILDGHQDRTFAESLAFAPGAREDVPVRCVEPDRDDGPSKRFVSARAMVHADLRREIAHGTQSSVWDEVRRYNAAHDIANDTSTYRTAAARQALGPQAAWRDRVVAALARLPERDRLVGVAVALEGRLISVDVFTTPALYRAMEPKLLGAVVAQAIDAHHEVRTPRPREIRALLAAGTSTVCGTSAIATAPTR